MYKLLFAAALTIAVSFGGQCLAGTYQITPSEDSWVYSFAPNTNYGSDTGVATDMHNMSFAGLTYFKFTLPALKNEIVQSATLHLYQFDGAGYGEGPTAVQLFSNNNWSETTITWNNAPAGTFTGLATCSDGHSHRDWSSWTFPWNFAYGSTFTLRVAENSSGDQSHWWYSKEYSDTSLRPYLEISTISFIPWRDTSTGAIAVWYMNGVTHTGYDDVGVVSTTWQIAGTGDFNGDGNSDILWRNTSTGAIAVWYMTGITHTGYDDVGVVSTTWQIAGTGDFNGDGSSDILWRNTSNGAVAIWTMTGITHTGYFDVGSAPLNWQIVGVGDFNGDGSPDILWRDTSNGAIAVWYMNGVTHTGYDDVGVVSTTWQIAGVADFNADRNPDILWRNTSNGAVAIWTMTGITHTGYFDVGSAPLNWQIAGQ